MITEFCSDASATELRYSFAMQEEFTSRKCPEKGACEIEQMSINELRGHIDRVTGKLEAKRQVTHYTGWKEDYDQRADHEWQMICTKATRQF
jgi:hypothetical protein